MFDFQTTDWDFPVDRQDIFDSRGEPISGHKAVVRMDTNEVLGVHGSRYTIVSNSDVVNSIDDAIRQANISRDVSVKISSIEGGRKMRGEILFNDLTVEPSVGDYVKFRISFFNSYDGSWAFTQAADGLRLFCLNGCTHSIAAARTRFKHTQSINVEASAAKIKTGLETFINQREVWQSWMATDVAQHTVELFFKHTLAKSFTRQTAVTKTNEKQLEHLLQIWDGEKRQLGSNKWALYNAMTYWSTHTSELKNPEVTRRNREDQIAKAMDHTIWHSLEERSFA
jgi:hypothetical protein